MTNNITTINFGGCNWMGIAIHPSSRSIIVNCFKRNTYKTSDGLYKLVELLEPMINEFKDAQIKSDQNLSDLLSSLPSTIDDEG